MALALNRKLLEGRTIPQLEKLLKAAKKDKEATALINEIMAEKLESEGEEKKPTAKKKTSKKKATTAKTKPKKPNKEEEPEPETQNKAKRGRPKKAATAPKKPATKKKTTGKNKKVDDTGLPYEAVAESLTATQLKKHGKQNSRALFVEPEQIKVRENFNVRQDMGDIEALATSILENGLLVPLHGDMDAEGNFTLTSGHRRLAAINLLIENGNEVKTVPVIANDKNVSETDRVFQIYIENDGKNLNPFEQGSLFQRLINLGWTQEQIGERVGVSTMTINNYLSANKLPKKTQSSVLAGEISLTKALDSKRKKRKSKGEDTDKPDYFKIVLPINEEDDKTTLWVYRANSQSDAKKIANALTAFLNEYQFDFNEIDIMGMKKGEESEEE